MSFSSRKTCLIKTAVILGEEKYIQEILHVTHKRQGRVSRRTFKKSAMRACWWKTELSRANGRNHWCCQTAKRRRDASTPSARTSRLVCYKIESFEESIYSVVLSWRNIFRTMGVFWPLIKTKRKFIFFYDKLECARQQKSLLLEVVTIATAAWWSLGRFIDIRAVIINHVIVGYNYTLQTHSNCYCPRGVQFV